MVAQMTTRCAASYFDLKLRGSFSRIPRTLAGPVGSGRTDPTGPLRARVLILTRLWATMPGPGPGAFGCVDPCAIPAVLPLQSADPAFASRAPLDGSSERRPGLDHLSSGGGFALARDHHVADAGVDQVV